LKLVKIRYKDVVVVESKQNYVLIYTTTQRVLTYMSLIEISKILYKHQGFIQFHRSFIIGKDHIVSIDKQNFYGVSFFHDRYCLISG